MSSVSSSSGGAQVSHRRLSKRTKLRNGTFIIPSTGERSRRQISLRTSSSLLSSSASSERFRSLLSPQTWRERVQAAGYNVREAASASWAWANSEPGRAVLKCSLAYVLGSLATFWSPLSRWLGNRDGKHIVATLTVYFHPARTLGSMLEAVLMSIVAVAFAEVISLLSMALPIVFRPLGLLHFAHGLVLVLFLGGGLGFIGWIKQRLNSPLSNVASTLASIAIISVVTKEDAVTGGHFSGDKIVQVLKMLVIGVSITVAVNVLVWRKSARRELRQSTVTASMALGDVLSAITSGFLNGTEDDLRSEEFAQVSSLYGSAHADMTRNLREVKFEQYFFGWERTYKIDKAIVKSMESLSQAIGGLRSASNTQFALLRESATAGSASGPQSPGTTVFSPTLSRSMTQYLRHAKERAPALEIIEESDENDHDDSSLQESDPSLSKSQLFRAPSDIFELFIALLGPSMKSLAWTLSEILREPPFGEAPEYNVAVKEQFRESLQEALDIYNTSRGNALQELYRSIELGRSRSEKIQADIEEVAAACGHFSFSLLAVAEEMDSYLDVLDDLKEQTVAGKRSWNWLRFWRHRPLWRTPSLDDPESEGLLQKPVRAIKKSALPKGIPDTMVRQRDQFSWDAAPQASRVLRLLSKHVLLTLRFLARDDIRFGTKVAIGVIVWAAFAFLPATRPTYMHWRGEWGLLSFMIVVSMTKGAANTTGFARFLGTVNGVVCSLLAWFISQGNAWALGFIGWIVSLANFYLILVLRNGPLGRISLLAYNVMVLYAYSLSQKVEDDDDDEGGDAPLILDICWHRFVAVSLGILWGIIVCRVIWPISGRSKFREGLSVLYLQLGLIWKRGPLATLLRDQSVQPYLRAGEQAALQRYAYKLDILRTAAKSEFSLRGPFPVEPYARIMASTNRILDGLYAMRLITEKRANLSEGERALMLFTASEREQLCSRISHIFQVLASSLMLEYPLTDAIPNVEGIKDRLLGKIYHFRKDHASVLSGADDLVVEEHDYALLYAYTLVTAQVADELTKVQKEIEGLFGVLHEESLLLQ